MNTRHLFASVLLAAFCGSTFAQEDPFDLTATQQQVEELGIPTASKVESLGEEATSLFEAEKCEEALPKLEAYARQANFLANIISAGIEPYYDASYDDKKTLGGIYASVLDLAAFETMSNDYKKKRNQAMVMQGICLQKIGREKEAISHLMKALNLIDINSLGVWIQAKNALYELVEAELPDEEAEQD